MTDSPKPEGTAPIDARTSTAASPRLSALYAYEATAASYLSANTVGSARVHEVALPSSGGDAPAYIVGPAAGEAQAGLLLIHGGSGDRSEHLAWAKALATRGVVSALVSAPFARVGGPPLFAFDAAVDRDIHHVQAVADWRRAIDLLEADFLSSGAPIGAYGHSYGAVLATILAGVDERIRGTVVAAAGARQSRFLADAGRRARGADWDATAYAGAMSVIDPINYVGLAADSSLLFQNGRRDLFVTEGDARDLHAGAGTTHLVQWYDAGHDLGPAARSAAEDWLLERLGVATPEG